MWKLSNSLMNENLIKPEIKNEIKIFYDWIKMETYHIQTYKTQRKQF